MPDSTFDELAFVIRTMARTAIDNEQRFTELDAVVGDGDFGFSLARGFEHLLAELDGFERVSTGAYLKRVGMAITMKIGGTSGPIWGTAFMRAGDAAGESDVLSGAKVVELLRAAIDGIRARGNAELGDKTLLDALAPAVDSLEAALAEGASGAEALGRAAATAREAAEATRSLEARRGRAAYAGPRSIGSLDAGAVAVAEMFTQLDLGWREHGSPDPAPAIEESR